MTNRELKAEIVRGYGTQFRFAVSLGIREARVSEVIRGRHKLTDEEQQKWAAALGVKNTKRIFGGSDGTR